MTEEQTAKLAVWKLTGELSCMDCIYLYGHAHDWQSVGCAHKKLPDNPNYNDLKTGRCEHYCESDSGPLIIDEFGNIIDPMDFIATELHKIETAYRESHD